MHLESVFFCRRLSIRYPKEGRDQATIARGPGPHAAHGPEFRDHSRGLEAADEGAQQERHDSETFHLVARTKVSGKRGYRVSFYAPRSALRDASAFGAIKGISSRLGAGCNSADNVRK